MTTSKNGRSFIESCEGCILMAYLDQRGIPTIGYGHTAGVKIGDTCDQPMADQWLQQDLAVAEGAVNRLVKPALTQNQFDALVSLTYNIGQENFLESTVLKRLNFTAPPDLQAAADAFLMWDKVGGETNQGLVNRRTAERALFLTPAPAC